MGLFILSKETYSKENLFTSIALVSLRKGFKFCIEEHEEFSLDKRTEVYIHKHFNKDINSDFPNYFYMDLISPKEQIELNSMDGMNLVVDSDRFFMIAGTDQTDYPRLMYDFSLEYLRLNPDHCISFHGETFFFLKDMEDIESRGGYFDDWCFENPHDKS